MPSTELTDLDPVLQSLWLDIEETYEAEYPEHALKVTCTYRSPEEQFRLYQQGRRQVADGSWVVDEDPTASIVTYLDGHQKKSKHNRQPAEAVDFCVLIGGKVSWDSRDYVVVGALARERGLVWGGDWPKLRDYPHVELSS